MDDEVAIRKFVCQILSKTYNVLSAESEEEAIRLSRDFEGRIQLLLSNVQMPGMTGIQLGTRLNQERPDLHVMLMSGFTDGMHKPFIPSQLLALIASILKRDVPEIGDLDEHLKQLSYGRGSERGLLSFFSGLRMDSSAGEPGSAACPAG